MISCSKCGSPHPRSHYKGRSHWCKECRAAYMRAWRRGPQGRARPEVLCWQEMIRRCHDPRKSRFGYYGGRGIVVAPEWRESFATFLRDMGPRPSPEHSIERKDNNGPYAPWNCAWATRTVQARNKRNNRYLTAFGETRLLIEWAERYGLHKTTILSRIERLGWDVERALSTPPAPGGRRRRAA